MNPRVRTAISVLFILGFSFTAPLVLLRTSGYRVNWQRQRIEKTGSIRVETEPAGATVSIDGGAQPRPTPLSVTRLLPEEYVIRVTKSGYLPWEKRLAVKSGQTAFATGIRLFRDDVPQLAYAADATDAAWTEDGSRAAFVRTAADWRELVTFDADKATATLLARFSPSKYADVSLSWSPQGDGLLFTGNAAAGNTEIIAYRASDAGAAAVLHEGLPEGRLTARWSDDGTAVLIMSDAGLFRGDPNSGATTALSFAPDIQDAVVAAGRTYIARLAENGGTVLLERLDADGRTPFAELPPGTYRFVDGLAGRLAVVEARRSRLTFIDADGAILTTVDAGEARPEPRGGRRVLAWNDFEVGVVDPRLDAQWLITRLGTPVRSCEWHPDGSAVLCATDTTIFAAELDDRDRRNVHDLVKFTGVGAFAVSPSGDALRFVGAAGGQHGVFERDL